MEEHKRDNLTQEELLIQYAKNAAGAMRRSGAVSGRTLSRRLRTTLKEIGRCHDRTAQWAAGHKQIPQAVEWLLDNWYLAQREGLDSAAALQHAGVLPAVRRERQEGAVWELARALAGIPPLSVERLAAFLSAVQENAGLDEKELSCFVPALKGALIERLAAACGTLEPLLRGSDYAMTAEEKREPEAEQARSRERIHAALAGSAKTMEALFTSLRTLAGANLGPLLEEASLVERLLREDPAGAYRRMDEDSRARYRSEVCRLAKRRGLTQAEAARKALRLAEQGSGARRHVGWYLFREPLGAPARSSRGTAYVAAIVLPTLFLVLLGGYLLDTPLVVALLLLPVSDLVKNCVDFIAVRLFRPRYVHRMDLRKGVPDEGRTLCVIASLLTGRESGGELVALLERYRLANRNAGDNLLFGILADLPDSDLPMGTASRGYVAAATEAVERLNEKYGGGFYLVFRPPVFQTVDERYMGWERKRGALLELARLLRSRRTALHTAAGDAAALRGVQYVITLDSDTSLNVGAAARLIGAMLHPLNRPEIDGRRRVVTSGYGLLQPRVGVELAAANRSQFSRIFAGQGGVDPYGSTTSDVYHDLFDQGTYTGKGIFDVDAFLSCLEGRFPQNRILSHDLLEGSYLHAGLIGDVELTDSYPYKVTSYFTRLHRWVRGDWQLLPWLGRRVRDEEGERVPNPISPIARWKIFDNLRRSLSPVCTLLALLLGMCVSGAAFAAAAAAAILAAASNLLLSGADLALRFGRGLRRRYHSTIIAGFGGVILQTLVQLLFLPYHAWTCFSAMVTALWRSLVTHRGLLAWVTAADAERRAKDSVVENYRRQWFSVLAGAVAMACATLPAGAAAGLVWVLSPVFAWALSRPIGTVSALSTPDRAFLLHEGGLIWRYFTDFLRPEDHWLPPDNYQEQPAVGLARRTSPTNVGMALLSVMAAADLELASRKKAVRLLGHMLDSLETLPKWNGHFYNWYDTASARPLQPRYVSTVDSGNLCGCLIALREGLYEWGEGGLARRAEALSDAMDFSLLYDRERKLFFIGYDVEKGVYTQGWYDLMASEARQTSYIAVARGQVDERHWRRLGRMLVKDNDYSGLASWTGTMFEYFMPNLLLPCDANSLMYESLAFCLYAQRRRAQRNQVPWGISESGFYAFDPGMSYQYKAHGVQKLGLKRGLDSELVVSPYSSFLALLLAPEGAARNLRRLRDMGLEGKYGLYEAADFTPSRRTGDARWEPVRSFMVHHLGMSLVSIDNALKDHIMQRRFLRDCSMSAYRELLQEKVPVGAAIDRPREREVPEVPRRSTGAEFRREGTSFQTVRPACHLLSNGSYTVLCTDAGMTRSSAGKTLVTAARLRGREKPSGAAFALRTGSGDFYPLTPAPFYREGCAYTWTFTGSEARWRAETEALTAKVGVRVAEENGELREVVLSWRGGEVLEGELCCYLEPVLADERDYDAHPAFSKLSIESSFVGSGVLFTRRQRGTVRPQNLAVVWDAGEARFDTSRERALGRGGLRALEQALSRPAGGTLGAVLDPCLLVRFPVRLSPGEQVRIRLSLGVAEEEEDALNSAQRLLRLPKERAPGRLDALLRIGGISAQNALQAFELLSALVYPPLREADAEGSPQQAALWPFGISGDLPIAVFGPADQSCMEGATELLRQHKLLRQCGFSFDAVVLAREDGDYRRPVYGALMDALKDLGEEGQLAQRGGVFLVNAAQEGTEAIVAAAAAHLLPGGIQDPPEREACGRTQPPFALRPGLPKERFTPDGTFVLETGGTLPPLGWSQMLANPVFGWMTDETGCGHLWCRNARENPLTPWENDPLEIGGTESLSLELDGCCWSLLAAADGLDCTVRYAPGRASWEKRLGERQLRTTAFVPRETPARVVQITLDGAAGTERLVYRFLPQLTADRQGGRFAQVCGREDYLVIQNPWNRAFWPQTILIAASEPNTDWRRLRDGTVEVALPLVKALTLVVGCASSQAEERAVLDLANPLRAAQALEESRRMWAGLTECIAVDTPDRALNRYLNRWTLYQTVACRLWGRTSRYQSGGAYGFRDQLQDVCAILFSAPELAREQLLKACAHQFEEGDVQHWWHETLEKGAGRGVRTRISDDLLWLPYVLCEYVEKTGDESILTAVVPYLTARTLAEGELERYEQPDISQEMESVYDHALRAIDRVLERGAGDHGLLLMGGGDWNDGMNRVGAEGRGESVWLTWFAAHTLDRFSALAEKNGDRGRAERCREDAARCREAAGAAWDGAWFLRGYYDDGTPLGSGRSRSCRIDSIAQSWAAIADCRDRERVEQALRAALEQLWDKDRRLIKLFTPPFSGEDVRDPGYIRGYVPGVRENGGQYTHAAVWLAYACFCLDLREEGWKLLHALLPSDRDTEVYRAEPYVLAADVYANEQHPGRGGWSWYTGAAGWYYRVALEELLGLKLRRGRLFVEPRLPDDWPGYSAVWRTELGALEITVRRGGEPGSKLDGRAVPDGVPLQSLQGGHKITVTV